MLSHELYLDLQQLLQQVFQKPIPMFNVARVSGGSINQSYCLQLSGGEKLFCKINDAVAFPNLFQAEKEGLLALSETGLFKIPAVLAQTELHAKQVLLLEWIDSRPPTAVFFSRFGSALVQMHAIQGPYFGWPSANYMGSVPQQNTPAQTWSEFFITQRLQPLAAKCMAAGLLTNSAHGLLKKLEPVIKNLFSDGEPPVLLHGDIWSGNFLCHATGTPVLIDPAVYWGHRAMDIGLTRLFGGFDAAFYEAYFKNKPNSQTFESQVSVCQLYPLLIHLLLFGKSYLPAINQTIAKLL